MAGFCFKPMGDIQFPITNEKGELIKLYTLRVGTEDFLRLISEKGAACKMAGLRLSGGEYTPLLDALKEFIDFALGPDQFDLLYNHCDRNPFAMLELVGEMMKVSNAEVEGRLKAYV